MKKFLLISLGVWLSGLLLKPTKVHAPIRNKHLQPGTLLFSPVGKRESYYVGHVGIVTTDQHVIHSIPSGMIKDSIEVYYRKFSSIRVYEPVNKHAGVLAAGYAEKLQFQYPKAAYKVFSPLGLKDREQYCTKMVWQAYYYGANINLGSLPSVARAVHPLFLKNRKHFKVIH